MCEAIRIRVHGAAALPTLVYLPGLHGDWTLVSSFRAAVAGHVRFVECSYPRTVSWSLEAYAEAIESALVENGIESGWLLGESFGSQPAWQLIARSVPLSRNDSFAMGSAPASGAVAGASPATPAGSDLSNRKVRGAGGSPTGEGAGRNTRGRVCSPSSVATLRLRLAPVAADGDRGGISETSHVGPAFARPAAAGPSAGSGALCASDSNSSGPPTPRSPFHPEGLILAGGFVRHPVIPGVRVMGRLNAALPASALQRLFCLYAWYAGFRHRHAPETLDSLAEFMTNRLAPGDQEAIVHRLDLIASCDPGSIALQTQLPVHYLAGLVDPLVPFPFVRTWLRRHCPGYRGGRTILNADHNVLATAPQTSANQILAWMGLEP